MNRGTQTYAHTHIPGKALAQIGDFLMSISLWRRNRKAQKPSETQQGSPSKRLNSAYWWEPAPPTPCHFHYQHDHEGWLSDVYHHHIDSSTAATHWVAAHSPVIDILSQTPTHPVPLADAIISEGSTKIDHRAGTEEALVCLAARRRQHRPFSFEGWTRHLSIETPRHPRVNWRVKPPCKEPLQHTMPSPWCPTEWGSTACCLLCACFTVHGMVVASEHNSSLAARAEWRMSIPPKRMPLVKTVCVPKLAPPCIYPSHAIHISSNSVRTDKAMPILLPSSLLHKTL